MKKFIILAALLVSGSAFAQNTASGTNTQDQTSTSEARVEAGAVAIGCLVNCTNGETSRDISRTVTEVIQSGTTTIKNTPSVNASPLVSSNDTCMGSASGAVNGPGFGIALGKTYKDDNCVMLKNSRELWNMGMKAAALALMCTDSANREALELTGFICPQTAKARNEARAAAAPAQQYTDPIVRERLGLPALK